MTTAVLTGNQILERYKEVNVSSSELKYNVGSKYIDEAFDIFDYFLKEIDITEDSVFSYKDLLSTVTEYVYSLVKFKNTREAIQFFFDTDPSLTMAFKSFVKAERNDNLELRDGVDLDSVGLANLVWQDIIIDVIKVIIDKIRY